MSVTRMTVTRRLLRNQMPRYTSRINKQTKAGDRIRSLNFVAASNIVIAATMDARYEKRSKPVVKGMSSLDPASMRSSMDSCWGSEKYFHALRDTQINTAPSTTMIIVSIKIGRAHV